MKLISHPNIVTIFDTYENDKYYYIVMELMNGGELSTHLDMHDLADEEVIRVMY